MSQACEQPFATAPSAKTPILSIRDLKTVFRTDAGIAKAVDGVSFDVFPGEVLGIVGESGSGKTVASLSILRLIPDPPGKIVDGQILFHGEDLRTLPYGKMRSIRGRRIAMIFQEPMTALNPVFTVGMQITEILRTHFSLRRREAFDQAVDMLGRVGIPDARNRMDDYPHQFSGGMRQRVMIAMALVCNPELLIADEPTTALDVTIQAQILDLMLELKAQREKSAIILITHDLSVVAETCDRVIVMYGGKVQEVGTVERIFSDPQHPYTRGLLQSLPTRRSQRRSRLPTIRGNVPVIFDLPAGCKFCTRCDQVVERCEREEPILHDLGSGHQVRCHLVDPMGGAR